MGQQQVKAFAERGRSGKNNKSLTKNKDVEKSELHASSGKPMLSTEMLNRLNLISQDFMQTTNSVALLHETDF